MKIKVCGMRDAHNINEIKNLNVDYLGFIFYPKSPRFVTQQLPDIFSWSAKKVGVFVNEEAETIVEKVDIFGLAAIQLHGSETLHDIERLRALLATKGQNDIEIWKAFGVAQCSDFDGVHEYEKGVDKFLFDTKTSQHGGSGQKFDWSILERINIGKSFFLSGGIDEEDAEKIKKLSIPNLYGVDVNSKFEISPAMKDVEKIKRFINVFGNF